jgi:hypothetical protein
MTHSHFCKHCDSTWSCTEYICSGEYDVKHECGERERDNRRLVRMLRGSICKYKCSSKCSHPPLDDRKGGWPYEVDFVRPQIITAEVNGKVRQVVVCLQNPYSVSILGLEVKPLLKVGG